MRGTRPMALDTIFVTDPRASSSRMPGSPPTVISVSVRARRLFVTCANARSATSRTPDDVGKGPGLRGCDLDAIHWARRLIVGARKHLEGTSDIEQLAIGKREQQNVVWRWPWSRTLAVAPH